MTSGFRRPSPELKSSRRLVEKNRSEGSGHDPRDDHRLRLIGIGGGLSRIEERQEPGLNNPEPGLITPRD
jgi:hypothetical protein